MTHLHPRAALKRPFVNRVNMIITEHLNISSIRNKVDALIEKIKGNNDLLMISETKLSDSFPTG